MNLKTRLTLAVVVMFVALVVIIHSLSFHHPILHEISDFDYLKQPDDITCGPTSTTMVLNRYGKDVTLGEVEKETKTQWFKYDGKYIGMTSPEYIPIAMKHFGVPSRKIRGYVNRLKYYVGQDRPCIVLLRSGEYTWHYVVVIGYDHKYVFVADPGSGRRRKIKTAHFESSWKFVSDMKGKSLDAEWMNTVLRAAEVYPYTMIVPNKSIRDTYR